MRTLLKHDYYLQQLSSSLSERYDLVMEHVPIYSNKKRLVAEIDILAVKEGVYDIYEVKCSHRISKAKRQLAKIRKIVSKQGRVRNSFFFCGESGLLVSIEQ